MDFINFKIVKISMYHCIGTNSEGQVPNRNQQRHYHQCLYVSFQCVFWWTLWYWILSHFMTKGRGDSTNSLETHVNLVQPLNKQSDIYLQNGQICKFKIKRTYASTFPPTPEQILVTVLSIKPFHLFHQNYLTPPSEFGINSFESWIPARRPFQTSLFILRPKPTAIADLWPIWLGQCILYVISRGPVIIHVVAVVTVITIFSSSSPPL